MARNYRATGNATTCPAILRGYSTFGGHFPSSLPAHRLARISARRRGRVTPQSCGNWNGFRIPEYNQPRCNVISVYPVIIMHRGSASHEAIKTTNGPRDSLRSPDFLFFSAARPKRKLSCFISDHLLTANARPTCKKVKRYQADRCE